MKKQIVFGMLLLVFTACKTTQEQSKAEDKEDAGIEASTSPYFKGNGNEPFWNIQISEAAIQFESLIPGFEKVIVPHVVPSKAMDANVKMYRVTTENADFQIQIQQMKCQNSMSGEWLPYAVTVELKRNTESDFTVLKGCGSYITDYRLHDIWVLEQLNGRKVELSDFNKELPLIEINAAANTFMGFAGCNQMNGRLFSEKNLLGFDHIVTTRMACGSMNKEGEFLKALQSVSSYKIKDNRLWLSNPSGLLIVFKKID
ncbi:META domain-containing protein [Flavobacterium sp.]|uniref:META domain-containing protein n=1 Tax=Flavobacterium sp. TaxID=239 RepID=UPI003D6A4432